MLRRARSRPSCSRPPNGLASAPTTGSTSPETTAQASSSRTAMGRSRPSPRAAGQPHGADLLALDCVPREGASHRPSSARRATTPASGRARPSTWPAVCTTDVRRPGSGGPVRHSSGGHSRPERWAGNCPAGRFAAVPVSPDRSQRAELHRQFVSGRTREFHLCPGWGHGVHLGIVPVAVRMRHHVEAHTSARVSAAFRDAGQNLQLAFQPNFS